MRASTAIRSRHVGAADADEPQQVACQGPLAVLFFAPESVAGYDKESPRERHQRERQAKALCLTCPVIVGCLVDALDHGERHGVWGGTSEEDRGYGPGIGPEERQRRQAALRAWARAKEAS